MGKKNPKPASHGGKKPPITTPSSGNARPPQNAVRFVKSPVRLTISLLVSNRIDTIRKCLNSIKPLMDALPCELIVVDTVGPERSDGSLAVAREFTDRIVRFEWCDDFSTARNAGLQLAKGEWFLFLDDDEWFEDVSEIIDFLKTADGRYNTCIFRQRNYKDHGGRQYSDGHVERLARRSDALRFKDRIHEYMVGTMPGLKELDVYVHHYGYIYDSQEAFERHHLRNLQPLEKSLEEKPGYLRAITHLAQEYHRAHDFEKMETLCRDALDKNDHPENGNYISVIAYFYIHALIKLKKWKDISEQSARILRRTDISPLAKTGIRHQLNDSAFALFDAEGMLSNVDAYFHLVDILDADQDQLASQQIMAMGACVLEPNRAGMMECGLKRAIEMGDEARTWAYIRRAASKPGENHLILEKCLPMMVPYAMEKGAFETLYPLIGPHLEKDSSMACFLSAVQSCLEPVALYKTQVRLVEYLNTLNLDRPYFVLLKIRAAEKAGDLERLKALYDHLFSLEGAGFAHEMMRLACRHNLDLNGCVGKFDIDQWDKDMRQLADSCPKDEAQGILAYLKGGFPENAPEVLSLEAALKLKAIIEDKAQNDEALYDRLRGVADLLYAFHQTLSSAGNFAFERCNCLGAGARAAFYLKQSIDLGDRGDFASQARMLKMALGLKSDLVDYVNLMMKAMEKRIERKNAAPKAQANAEFQALTARLKGVVAEFILKGDMVNARHVLDQLSQILPGDPDIRKLYMQLYQ